MIKYKNRDKGVSIKLGNQMTEAMPGNIGIEYWLGYWSEINPNIPSGGRTFVWFW
jgi:hypothetical protein